VTGLVKRRNSERLALAHARSGESSLFITFVVLVTLAAIHLNGEGPNNNVLAWKCTHTATLIITGHCAATEQIKGGRLANSKFKPAFLENIFFKFHETFRVV